MRSSLLVLFVSLCSLLVLLPVLVSSQTVQLWSISTPLGVIVGKLEQGGGSFPGTVASFLGLPFAAPPVGDLRFKSPQPPAKLSSPYAATTYKNICTQPSATPPYYFDGNEDCLYLNVFTPYPLPAVPSLAPVYVYIYGGGFVAGSAKSNPGHNFVRASGAVVVTVGYRVGPFGFLATPALSAEKGPGNVASSGNFGIEDQQAALRWVQDNIEWFGGDKNRVTIGGESAGAISTCIHLLSPLSAGLFSRVIMESGGCDTGRHSLTEAENNAMRFTSAIAASKDTQPWNAACDGSQGFAAQTSCLRNQSIPAILGYANAAGVFNYFDFTTNMVPNIDGWIMPDWPANLMQSGRFNKVPVLLGSNAEEMAVFIAPINANSQFPPASIAAITQVSATLSGNNTAIMDYYINGATNGVFPSVYRAYSSLLSKSSFQCPTRRVAKAFATAGLDVYHYLYNYSSPFATYSAITGGAIHSEELNFVFGLADSLYNRGSAAFQPNVIATWNYTRDMSVSNQMRNYWGRFIVGGHTAGPNLNGIPTNTPSNAWNTYTTANPNSFTFSYDGTSGMNYGADPYATECALWDALIVKSDAFQPRINPGGPNPNATSSTGGSGGNILNAAASTSMSVVLVAVLAAMTVFLQLVQ